MDLKTTDIKLNNALFKGYDIHVCAISELPEVKNFIDQYWKKEHILIINQSLMDWQHFDAEKKRYNFVIARSNTTDEIHGVLGFISNDHFDSSLKDRNVLWMAIWKVRNDVRVPGLGMALLSFLLDSEKPYSIGAMGLSRMVVLIYQRLDFCMGKLKQYYIVNKGLSHFDLIDHFDGRYVHERCSAKNSKKLVRCEKSSFLEDTKDLDVALAQEFVPGKSLKYLYNRYCKHPVYDYQLFSIVEKESIQAIVVLRQAMHGSGRALRLVDFYGNPESLVGTLDAFQHLLRSCNAEYVDFYNTGFEEELIFKAGFLERPVGSKVIIPSYFEPFERSNIDLDYAYWPATASRYQFFRGDSDQDRPN